MLALLRHEEGNAELPADDDASEIVKCCAIERQGAAHENVQHNAQAPDVGSRPIVLQSLKDLRRGIWRRPAESFEINSFREVVAEAEVGKLQWKEN